MSGVELGLALVATIDLCFRHGSRLVQLCRSVRDAEAELKERIVYIENHWQRTSSQIEFLRRIWDSLDPGYQSIQLQTLQVLNSKLTVAITKIDGLISRSTPATANALERQQGSFTINRWRYATRKDDLDKIIKELEEWQRVFDPSWFLILMMSNSQIDAELQSHRQDSEPSIFSSAQTLRKTLHGSSDSPQKSVFLGDDVLSSATISDIPFSSCQIARRAGSTRVYILNSVSAATRGNHQWVVKDIRELATRLSFADPADFGLLRCKGVIRQTGTTLATTQNIRPADFTLVFRMEPSQSMPQSLRARLLDAAPDHSLSDRLDVARYLIRSISSVHTFGFVHKNVCPENILLCTQSTSSLGRAFLVGFEEFRTADGASLRRSDAVWQKDLYRHPNRQGFAPDQYYVMQHDIYSLGVCLLEIGLWESFVVYDGGQSVLSPIMIELSNELLFTWQPEIVKQVLLQLARTRLHTRMGTKFANIVETCLTCLDEGNVDFGDESEFRDPDGVVVGVRYIEKVLLQLDSISM